MNVFSFTGNLGQDPELRDVNGNQVLNMSVANNVGYGDNQKTLWVRCAIWGQRAQSLYPILSKGKTVFVSGTLDLSTYQKNDGGEGYNLDLNVKDIRILSRGDEEQSEAQPQQAPQVAAVQGGRGKW